MVNHIGDVKNVLPSSTHLRLMPIAQHVAILGLLLNVLPVEHNHHTMNGMRIWNKFWWTRRHFRFQTFQIGLQIPNSKCTPIPQISKKSDGVANPKQQKFWWIR
jgi:hypothetical protein